MVLSGRSLTMEETPAEEVDNAEPRGTKADFPRVLSLDLHKSYVCITVYIYISLAIGVYIRKNRDEMPNESHRGEARCDAKLTRRRLGALACLLAGEYCRASFSCRCVIVDDGNNPYFSGLHSVKSMTNARNPFGKLARQVYRYPSSLMTIARRYIRGEPFLEREKRRKISIHGLFVYTSLRNVRRKDDPFEGSV